MKVVVELGKFGDEEGTEIETVMLGHTY